MACSACLWKMLHQNHWRHLMCWLGDQSKEICEKIVYVTLVHQLPFPWCYLPIGSPLSSLSHAIPAIFWGYADIAGSSILTRGRSFFIGVVISTSDFLIIGVCSRTAGHRPSFILNRHIITNGLFPPANVTTDQFSTRPFFTRQNLHFGSWTGFALRIIVVASYRISIDA